jgi:hypothetical protein
MEVAGVMGVVMNIIHEGRSRIIHMTMGLNPTGGIMVMSTPIPTTLIVMGLENKFNVYNM